MAKIKLKPLFCGPMYQTQVWVAEDVLERIVEGMQAKAEAGTEAKKYMAKVKYYATGGFKNFEGPKGGIRAKSSWKNVLAIEPWATLFRLYGGYEQAQKKDFLILSCSMKKGGKMLSGDKEQAEYAEAILAESLWEKVTDE